MTVPAALLPVELEPCESGLVVVEQIKIAIPYALDNLANGLADRSHYLSLRAVGNLATRMNSAKMLQAYQ